MRNSLESHKRTVLEYIRSYSFNKPIDLIRQKSQMVDDLDRRLTASVQNLLNTYRIHGENMSKRILSLDPKKILKRGFAIVRQQTGIISRAADLKKNENALIEFSDGIVETKILK
jgi:exodeoxyribonuclease VII large subunit